jgi:hypothetical protein
MTYGELQEALGSLIHGKRWQTLPIPKPVAKIGAWAQDHAPFVEEPFIKPWMIALSDDHYDLDITQARKLLNWKPTHRLKDTLPKMVQALQANPDAWYRENKLNLPSRFERLARSRAFQALFLAGAGIAGYYWLKKGRREALPFRKAG